MYVTIKYRKRGRIKKAICRGDDKKERSEEEGKERRKRRRAHTRRRERARMTLGRGGGARSATSISGIGGGGGLCEWSEKVDGSVEKKIAGRLFSCRNFYWRVRHAGPMGGGRRRWQGIGGRPGQRIRSGVQ